MEKTIVIQGKKIAPEDIELIKKLIEDNPSWGRTRLSKELCILWSWKNSGGRLKDMACRSLLLRLDKQKLLTLPAPKKKANNDKRNSSVYPVLHSSLPISAGLKDLLPVEIKPVEAGCELDLFKCFLSLYHYLGFSGTVGENLKYMAYDRNDRPLACLLFGSSAWACSPRDCFIGWDRKKRQKNLSLTTNNMRFLIPPWVSVKYLASHILSKVCQRIKDDWEAKYGHPVYLLETFVERDRFAGTCYKASNWTHVGETTGRSRNDIYNTMKVPVKDIYLYPLAKKFREVLCR
ncbi:MAG: DUF4338 domain-containing protein [Spirochaetales bacterium]|jgi:hypothetical protein|nr:DUF4338 domain-containing protein [Spirochaetales bacterium]